jgi:hypothetical protein
MRKLTAIIAASTIFCSTSVAQEEDYVPMTLLEFTQELLKDNSPDILVLGAEIFGKSEDGETPFYYAVGSAVAPFASAPVVVAPCRFPPIVSPWVGNYWYPWCEANNASFPNHEAQRDTYVSINGRPPLYNYSVFFDCQRPLDKAAMPLAVRTAVC